LSLSKSSIEYAVGSDFISQYRFAIVAAPPAGESFHRFEREMRVLNHAEHIAEGIGDAGHANASPSLDRDRSRDK
jgi:hypothetical protein